MMKNKIIHLTSVHPRDDIRIFQKECKSLIERFEVVLIVADGKGNELKNGVQIIDVVKSKFKSRLLRFIWVTRLIYKAALEENGTIYHFHDPELIPVGLSLMKFGKKVIYDVHEDLPRSTLSKEYIPFFFRKMLSFLLEYYENYSAKKFNAVISATKHINNRFIKLNKNSVIINNYPFKYELIKAGIENYHLKENAICYIGAISRLRGVKELIEASKMADVKLYLAGSFSEKDFELEIKKLESWSNVIYFSHVSRDIVSEIMSKSICGIVTFLPAPNHCNSQPNKMFEYMSASLPVICSDFPLWRNLIEENNCGICVIPDNISAIVEAIQRLANDKQLSFDMGNNAYKAIIEKYNWDTEKVNLFKLYNNLL